jgi:hypothetical protein
MLRLAQNGLMQTRLTDRCPGSHLSSFATKAATNAAPSNRALALPFNSVRALEQFHARARGLHYLFTVVFYGAEFFLCTTAQFCATRRESEMAETSSIRNGAQACENERKNSFLN